MNSSDLEKLEQNISDLKTLYNTWSSENTTPPEVGECGGGAIGQMEELGEAFIEMKDAFLLLMEHTISYMEGRNTTSHITEVYLANGVKHEIN